MNASKFTPLGYTEMNPDEMIAASRSFYHSMKCRRSVRAFSDRAVPEEVIMNAIRTAGTAPSGANLQPWHFAVVSGAETKRKIREEAEKEERAFYQRRATQEWLNALQPLGTDEHKPFLETAPYLIVIFMKRYTAGADGQKQKTYYPTESVGIATGLLITALHLSGLATLTHTPSPMNFLNKILKRPDNERPFLILVTGYPHKKAMVPAITKFKLDQIATFY